MICSLKADVAGCMCRRGVSGPQCWAQTSLSQQMVTLRWSRMATARNEVGALLCVLVLPIRVSAVGG